MVEEPGTRFAYCDGASQLLSAILTEVTGKSASEFAAEVLFGPLGITDYVWPAGPDGTSTGWGELVLRPTDMAKIGYLYLRGGEWDGDRVVSQNWVNAAAATQIAAGTLSDGYGYQWWVDDDGDVMAIGVGGQYITVVPERDLVVVFTSGLPLKGEQWRFPENLIDEYVLPAVVSDGPLPPNGVAQARLAAAVEAAGSAPDSAQVSLPATATMIDGARYEFRPNDFGNQWFVLSFGDDSASLLLDVTSPLSPLRFTDTGAPIDIEVGLDGRFVTTEMWGQPIAARGTWLDDETCLIEHQMIHLIGRGTYKFTFSDDGAGMEYRELFGGTNQWSEADRAD